MKSIVIIILILISPCVWSQSNTNKYSINPLIGTAYDVNTKPWQSYGLAVNIFSTKYVYSTHYVFSNEMELFGSNDPKEVRNEFDLLFGRYFGDRYFRFQCQFGLGVFWGIKRGEKTYNYNSGYEYDTEKFTAIGVPLKMGFKYIPAKYISLGVDFQTNINSESTIFMVLFSIEFGLLRYEIKSKPID